MPCRAHNTAPMEQERSYGSSLRNVKQMWERKQVRAFPYTPLVGGELAGVGGLMQSQFFSFFATDGATEQEPCPARLCHRLSLSIPFLPSPFLPSPPCQASCLHWRLSCSAATCGCGALHAVCGLAAIAAEQ